jgi:hypothetical protein
MNGGMYEIVALVMRYFFAAIMVLIVARAWKISVVDSQRAKQLRRLAPETGFCGEFLVVTGDGRRVREGMRYPVIREGLVGSSRKADVRVKSASVRRAHAFFELTETGLRVRAQGRARMYDGAGALRREAMLGDGDRVTFGTVEMMLVLTDGQAMPGRDARADLFDVAPDAPRRKAAQPAEPDEVFDSWDEAFTARRGRDEPGDAWGAPQRKRSVKEPDDDPFDV